MVEFDDSGASSRSPYLALAVRQVGASNNCVLNSTNTGGSNVQEDCAATDYNCLCAQTSNAFADWVLDTVCNTCDGVDKLTINPISALASYCPSQATSRQTQYSCQFFTTFSAAAAMTTTISPSLVLTTVVTPLTLFPPASTSTSTSTPSVSSTSSTSQESSFTGQTSFSTSPSPTQTPSDTGSSPQTTNQSSTTFLGDAAATSSNSQPSSPSAITATSQKSGLSTGAKAGIGIAAAAIPLLLLLALLIFCWRRRKNKRSSAWELGGNQRMPDLYTEQGTLTAYEKAKLAPGSSGATSPRGVRSPGTPSSGRSRGVGISEKGGAGMREVFVCEDGEADGGGVRRSRIGLAMPMSPEPGDHRLSRIDLATPMSPEPSLLARPRDLEGALDDREITSLYSQSQGFSTPTPTGFRMSQDHDGRERESQMQGHSALLPSANANGNANGRESRQTDGRESQMSRPLNDMYAYGGEAIETDEELARLEEEERRIEEAIEESERVAAMRRQRERVRERIKVVRRSAEGGGDGGR